jgi:uncharacterized membrane protein
MFSATHLHAMIVHFPVALLLAGFFSETIGLISKKTFFTKAGFYLLILATAGALAAWFTGDNAGEGMEGGSLKKALDIHAQSALITLWLTISAAVARSVLEWGKKKMKWLKISAFLLFALAAAGVGRTGYLGGQLVYKHAAGVEIGIDTFNSTLPGNDLKD